MNDADGFGASCDLAFNVICFCRQLTLIDVTEDWHAAAPGDSDFVDTTERVTFHELPGDEPLAAVSHATFVSLDRLEKPSESSRRDVLLERDRRRVLPLEIGKQAVNPERLPTFASSKTVGKEKPELGKHSSERRDLLRRPRWFPREA
ncbi:MAG: hypothetical protein WD049_08095 [Candidatus Paceibacterota bacterium]